MTQTNRVPETVEEIQNEIFEKVYRPGTLHSWETFKENSSRYYELDQVYDILASKKAQEFESLLSEIKTLKEEREKLEKSVKTFETINTEIREHCRLIPGESIIQHIKHLEFNIKSLCHHDYIQRDAQWAVCKKCGMIKPNTHH